MDAPPTLGHCIDGLCLGWKYRRGCRENVQVSAFNYLLLLYGVEFLPGGVLKTQGFFKSCGQEWVVVSLSKPLSTADPMQRCFPGKALMLRRVVICSLRRRQPK